MDLTPARARSLQRISAKVTGSANSLVSPHTHSDQLPAALEHLQQRDRPVLASQRNGGVHLHHRQPPAGRRNRVTCAGVRLLPNPQCIQFGLAGGPAGHHRRPGVSVAPKASAGVWSTEKVVVNL
jgi:hypothetical protein